MSEEDDLARRFLALWAEYLTALVAEPQMAERWLVLAKAGLPGAKPDDATLAAAPRPSPGPPPDAAAAAGASDECDAVVAELARRVAELGERVTELEQARTPRGRAAGGTRRRNRTART